MKRQNNLRKRKKSQMVYSEIVLIVVSLSISLILTGLTFYINNDTKTSYEAQVVGVEYNPYPIVFLKTFLYTPLDNSVKKKFGFDENKNYFVYNLLELCTDNSLNEVKNIKQQYLESDDVSKSYSDYRNSLEKLNLNTELLNAIYSNAIQINKIPNYNINDLSSEDYNKGDFIYYIPCKNENSVIKISFT
jgi:hypothetical protein